jgi:MYXO-CTERM domain-containing protein
MQIIPTAALLALTGTALAGTAGIQITETWTGMSGEDGTADWIEVTYFGAGTFDTGSLFYDDASADIADGGQLDSFLLSNGQSAIFLLDVQATASDIYANAIEEFIAIWGPVSNVGYTNGGGGLGQGGDSANLLDAAGNVLDSLSYASSGDTATFEKLNGVTRLSVLGENGAYSSAEFFNDNDAFGAGVFFGSLVGSPGVVPAPAGVALLGLGGFAAARRRRD